MRLKDKVAIITGGSRGIGYATADAFLKEGAKVILTASSMESAQKAVAQLKEKYPDSTVVGISPDLSNLKDVREEFKNVTSKYGCVDILVNNAGVSESTLFTDYTEEMFDKVMDLNVKGVFNATKAASECMVARKKRCYFKYLFYGKYLRTAKRYCLSYFQICGKWSYGISCTRTGAKRDSCKCSSPRNYRNRHDEGSSKGSHRTDDCSNSFTPSGTTGGHC